MAIIIIVIGNSTGVQDPKGLEKMRKIETIQKEIEKDLSAIAKAEAAITRLQARMNNAIARLAKAGYEFKGDGSDPMNCINNVRLWSIAYTADEARKGIERRRAKISGRRMGLDRLNRELAEASRNKEPAPSRAAPAALWHSR